MAMKMKFSKLPEELEPTEEDYIYFDKKHDLALENTEEFYRMVWKDYIDDDVKEDYNQHKSEMRDEWREAKEDEDFVPPFNEWHEAVYDYVLSLETYIERNKDDIFNTFKEQIKEIYDPSDYFEDE